MMLITLLKKLYVVPSATLNIGAGRNMRTFCRLLAKTPEPLILNVGSGDRFLGGGRLAGLGARLVRLDIAPLSLVDVVGDAQRLPFAAGVFDGVVCQAVLEHVPRPWQAVGEMARVLQRGGLLYIEVPFMQGYHPSPRDYFRFTLEGLEELLADFVKVEAGVCVGPASTASWLAREFLAGVLSGFSGNKRLRQAAVFIAGWLTFPIKYLDLLLARRPSAGMIASGIYFIGSKK